MGERAVVRKVNHHERIQRMDSDPLQCLGLTQGCPINPFVYHYAFRKWLRVGRQQLSSWGRYYRNPTFNRKNSFRGQP
jgi:hypothetical protein